MTTEISGVVVSDIRIAYFHSELNVCVPGKRYNVVDVSAALCMSLGLVWFMLADSKVAPNFNVTGMFFKLHRHIPSGLL